MAPTRSEVVASRAFAWLAMIMAALVSLGTRTWLPVSVIFISVCLSWLLTDRLGLIRMSRLAGYFCMLIGAVFAIAGYWFDSNNIFKMNLDSLLKPNAANLNAISNLDAVSRMLIYIQIPLMFQRKDKRLFEHWGVFLILELVVAALLSDNAAFGALLFPTLVVGCMAMIYLAAYVGEYELQDEPASTFLPAFMSSMWRKKTIQKTQLGLIQLRPITSETNLAKPIRRAGWLVLAIGGTVSIFSLVYFFGLPRLHTGAFEGLGRQKPMVGFSGTIRLEDVGQLMMNDDLAMRLFLVDPVTKLPFQPSEPPYLRGVVAEVYGGADEKGNPLKGGWTSTSPDNNRQQLFRYGAFRNELKESQARISVSIQAQASLGDSPFSLPPFCAMGNEESLPFDPSTWCLAKQSIFASRNLQRDRYHFDSLAFNDSGQIPYLVDVRECLRKDRQKPEMISESQGEKLNAREQLVAEHPYLVEYDPSQFEGLIRVRDAVIGSGLDLKNVEKVLRLEEHLATSNDFEYSLMPAVKYNKLIDPIEDFVVNHRTGHCQYFASALAIMARTLNLPSRIVLGFHPAEYNDVGHFLTVRQRHAHAWVEVYFDRSEFEGSAIKLPDWIEGGVWLRFDPSPSGDSSNAGGSYRQRSNTGNAYETLEQLWQESFMAYDGRRQPAAFNRFSSWTSGPVASALLSIERLYLRLQTTSFTTVDFNAVEWISWQMGLAIVSLVGFVLLLIRYRMALSRFGWNSANKQPFEALKSKTRRIAFFQRAVKALKKLGWKRDASQTPREFSQSIQPFLDQMALSQSIRSPQLASLIEAYYSTRFGENEIPTEKMRELDSIVEHLEKLASQHRKWFT
jgi:protein-glutamine gamma-glutamyltransferase